MKRQLGHIISCLLLASTAFALPSYTAGERLLQAIFQAQGLSDQSFLEWKLSPNPNSTHHLIFNSVSGLLQRWPNTLRRNGVLDLPRSHHRHILTPSPSLFTARTQYCTRNHSHRDNFIPRTHRQSSPRCARVACFRL